MHTHACVLLLNILFYLHNLQTILYVSTDAVETCTLHHIKQDQNLAQDVLLTNPTAYLIFAVSPCMNTFKSNDKWVSNNCACTCIPYHFMKKEKYS